MPASGHYGLGETPCYNPFESCKSGAGALKVKVKLFAGYKDRARQAEFDLELPENSTVGHIAEVVARRYPAITNDPAALVMAVNYEYRDHRHVLEDGDEVALIPPVSGGSVSEGSGEPPAP